MQHQEIDAALLVAVNNYRHSADGPNLEALLAACSRSLGATLGRMVRRHEDVQVGEEAVQVVLALLCEDRELFLLVNAVSPVAWLTRIARNKYITLVRKQLGEAAKIRDSVSERILPLDTTYRDWEYSGDDPVRSVLAGEERQRIELFIYNLSMQERQLLNTLLDQPGMQLAEAYRELGWSPEEGRQVHRRLTRLAEHEFGPQPRGRRRR